MIEPIEPRRLLSVSFANGVLTVVGTAGNDVIEFKATAGGAEAHVNGVLEGAAAIRNLKSIKVDAGGGKDLVVIPNEPFPIKPGTTNIVDVSVPHIYVRAWVEGGAGNDTLIGGMREDTLVGGSGRDVLIGNGGNDAIGGGANVDKIDGGTGDDSLGGGGGGDMFANSHGADTFSGGTGRDSIDYSAVTRGVFVTLDGKANDGYHSSDDDPNSSGWAVNFNGSTQRQNVLPDVEIIIGGGFDDTLISAGGNDLLLGNNGNDWLAGYGGNDSIFGGDGADTVNGGTGTDILRGGPTSGVAIPERDVITYYDRTDNLIITLDGEDNDGAPGENDDFGQDGIDFSYFEGGQGSDSITGNDGDNGLAADPLQYEPPPEGSGLVTPFNPPGKSDTVIGFGGDDHIDGGYGADLLDGGAGNDWINAGGHAGSGDGILDDEPDPPPTGYPDTMHGGDGDDVLSGDVSYAPLNDLLYGGAGNDVLQGGGLLVGGGGKDVLSRGITMSGGAGNDSITGVFGVSETMLGGDGDDILDDILPSYEISDTDFMDGGAGFDRYRKNGFDSILNCESTIK